MLAFRISQLVFLFSAMLCSQEIAIADGSVLSTAYGLGGLNWIVRDSSLRDKIGIADRQLEDIKKFLSEKKAFVGLEAENNAVGKEFLAKVLTKNQANLLRIELVKTRIVTPGNLFEMFFMTELVENDQAVRMSNEFEERRMIVAAKIDRMRIEAIQFALDPDAQDMLWKFTGNEFLIKETEVDLEQISQWLSPMMQVDQAPYIVDLPEKLRLTIEQREQLRKISEEVRLKTVRGTVSNPDELEKQLNSVLSRSQRVAVVQSLNQLLVRRDLLIVLNPSIVKQPSLSVEDIAMARAHLEASKRDIADAEILQLVQASREVLRLKDVPPHFRKEVTELVAGVWEL